MSEINRLTIQQKITFKAFASYIKNVESRLLLSLPHNDRITCKEYD